MKKTEPLTASNSNSLRRVLLLDARMFTAALLTSEMEWHGYAIAHATTHWLALAVARRAQPDIAVLDLTLPHEDGWRAMEDLLLMFPGLPCVALVRNSEEGLRAMAQGAMWYIECPYQPVLLIAAVKTALAHHARNKAEHFAAAALARENQIRPFTHVAA